MVISSLNAQGTSVWTEGPGDFPDGTMDRVTLVDGNISLAHDDTAHREWTNLSGEAPSELAGAALVYDRVHNETLLFGGSSPSGYRNDTWAFNSTTRGWRKLATHGAPSPRHDSLMVFDDHNQEVLLYGGSDQYMRDETWVLNVTTWNWTDLHLRLYLSQAPYGMVYDTVSSAALLSMSSGSATGFGVYNSTTRAWTSAYHYPQPYPRASYGTSFDEANGVLVYFGGSLSPTNNFNETWTFDLDAKRWTQLFPSVSPSPRYDFLMTYDRATTSSLIIGGAPRSYNEIWSFNLTDNTWTNLTTSEAPLSYGIDSLAYDDATGQTLAYCGNGPIGAGYSVWGFDAAPNDWSLLDQSDAPCARRGHAMVYDGESGVGVLFGGEDNYNNETWLFDTATRAWTRKHPATAPSYSLSPSMSYDADRQRVLMFGASNDAETWVYDTRNDTWERKTPPESPSWAETYWGPNCAMAYDARNEVHVLLDHRSDTWTYDMGNGTWTKMDPPVAPSMRYGMSMAYDSTAGAIVLFGGTDYTTRTCYDEAWTYDYPSDTWTKLSPSTRPLARMNALLLDYPRGDGLLMAFGSTDYNSHTQRNDTWLFNTTSRSWTQLDTPRAPRCMDCTAGFYCDVDETVYVFGGGNRTYLPSVPAYTTYRLDGLWCLGPSGFPANGTYTSAPFNTGGLASFGNVSFDASAPQGTHVRLQLRGSALPGLLDGAFVGPDGTAGSYYDGTGQRIHEGLNTSRWIQYQATLSTEDPLKTPTLRGVTIRYNLLHGVLVTSPRMGDIVSASMNITWDTWDHDGDPLSFDIYLINNTGSQLLASDLPDSTREWPWNISTVPSGNYILRVDARDDGPDIPLNASGTCMFKLKNKDLDNRPPSAILIGPEDNATITTTTVDLTWSGHDEDGDAITYYVHVSEGPLGALTPGTLVTVTRDTRLTMTGLTDGATYSWTVVPNDGRANGTVPFLYRFAVAVPRPNRPPELGLASPPDAGTIRSTGTELAWTATDPDGDKLSFRVYLSEGPLDPMHLPPAWAIVAVTTCPVTGLANGTTYHWTVVAFDGTVNGTVPAAWSFKVDLSYGNRAPRITSTPPANATVGVELVYDIIAVDEDGDELTFALVSPLAGAHIDPDGRLTWVPDASQQGIQTLTVRAIDPWGSYGSQTLHIAVGVLPPVPPGCAILVPANGTVVNGTTTVSGNAFRGDGPQLRVLVRVDGGNWTDATGSTAWQYVLDTRALANGVHTIEVRAFDGLLYSDVPRIALTVDNPVVKPTDDDKSREWTKWVYFAVLVIVLLVITLLLWAAIRTRRAK